MESNKKIILVDFDNTIADTIGAFKRKFISSHPEEEPQRMENFKYSEIFPRYTDKYIDKFLQDNPLTDRDVRPFPDALMFLHRLKNLGCSLILETSNPNSFFVYIWLKAWDFEKYFDDVHIGLKRNHLFGDVLVDDEPIYIFSKAREQAKIPLILIKREYNEKLAKLAEIHNPPTLTDSIPIIKQILTL